MTVAVMTSKGQVTVPKEVRDQLGLKPGSRLEFALMDDGALRVWPICRSIRDLEAAIVWAGPRVSLEDMAAAIATEASAGAGLGSLASPGATA